MRFSISQWENPVLLQILASRSPGFPQNISVLRLIKNRKLKITSFLPTNQNFSLSVFPKNMLIHSRKKKQVYFQ